MPGAFEKIYEIVRRIPRGKVATYGQVSSLLCRRYTPLFVGWALHALPGGRLDIPWHRVLNARGRISVGRLDPSAQQVQRALLESEGVRFDRTGRCDLSIFGWSGDSEIG
ncbi:MAG: MGMT family protein [Candidatus Riflebacteria bacterium]|nr:MGMT family protein [Candidatus Riflebacteria bacterium]